MKEWTQIFNIYLFGIKIFTKEIIDNNTEEEENNKIGFNIE